MSPVPQTVSPARVRTLTLSLGAVAGGLAIVALARGALGHQAAAALAQARPHLPDMALFARLPVAIKLHMLAALGALVLGGAIMAVRKGRVFHRTAGWVWVALAATAAVSSLFITALHPGRWSFVHLLTAYVLLVLPMGVAAARGHNIGRHRQSMMGLFYWGFLINLAITFLPGRVMWRLFFG